VLGHYVRKYTHSCQDDDAFAISPDAKWLAKIEGDDLQFKAIRVPDESNLREAMQIKYKSTTQDNYGDACDKKQTFKDRIYRDLHIYHMYEEEKDETIVAKMSNGVTRD
jgi:hypothetical protein